MRIFMREKKHLVILTSSLSIFLLSGAGQLFFKKLLSLMQRIFRNNQAKCSHHTFIPNVESPLSSESWETLIGKCEATPSMNKKFIALIQSTLHTKPASILFSLSLCLSLELLTIAFIIGIPTKEWKVLSRFDRNFFHATTLLIKINFASVERGEEKKKLWRWVYHNRLESRLEWGAWVNRFVSLLLLLFSKNKQTIIWQFTRH